MTVCWQNLFLHRITCTHNFKCSLWGAYLSIYASFGVKLGLLILINLCPIFKLPCMCSSKSLSFTDFWFSPATVSKMLVKFWAVKRTIFFSWYVIWMLILIHCFLWVLKCYLLPSLTWELDLTIRYLQLYPNHVPGLSHLTSDGVMNPNHQQLLLW